MPGRKNRCMTQRGGQKSAHICIAWGPLSPERGTKAEGSSVLGASAGRRRSPPAAAQLHLQRGLSSTARRARGWARGPGAGPCGRGAGPRGSACGGAVPTPRCVRAPAAASRVRAAGRGRRLWAVTAGARALASSSRFALPRRDRSARWRLRRRLGRLRRRGGRVGRGVGRGGWTGRGGRSGWSRRLNSSGRAGGDAGCSSPPCR